MKTPLDINAYKQSHSCKNCRYSGRHSTCTNPKYGYFILDACKYGICKGFEPKQ